MDTDLSLLTDHRVEGEVVAKSIRRTFLINTLGRVQIFAPAQHKTRDSPNQVLDRLLIICATIGAGLEQKQKCLI